MSPGLTFASDYYSRNHDPSASERQRQPTRRFDNGIQCGGADVVRENALKVKLLTRERICNAVHKLWAFARLVHRTFHLGPHQC